MRKVNSKLRENVLAVLTAYADDPHNVIDCDLVHNLLEPIVWHCMKPATVLKMFELVLVDLHGPMLEEMSAAADRERGHLVHANAEHTIREALLACGVSEGDADQLADRTMQLADDVKQQSAAAGGIQ